MNGLSGLRYSRAPVVDEATDRARQTLALEDPEQRRRVTELLRQKAREDALREVLERLETDVRDWIAWARGQGAF